ncbi:MAG: protein-L-isoaspartate(D-aspartate) O-methyltransferase [Sandaracinaceae bacterium]
MSDADRTRMVERDLVGRGLYDARVLDAMRAVPRERFVPADLREHAYEDRALALRCGQTISQPYMVARMLQLAELEPHHRVLDVGTGSGYQAAVLAEIVREVVSIERVASLAETARVVLAAWPNVEVVVGDGTLGWPARAPYDAIVAAAATEVIPAAWREQLTDGGRVVVPVGGPSLQRLTVLEKDGASTTYDACVYVPLIAGDRRDDD